MSIDAVLTTLLPIRDRRERVIAYSVSSCPAYDRSGPPDADADARRTLEAVGTLTRLAGRSLVVPVTPAVLREGSVTRFASTDAVWLLATDAMEDAATRRAVERLLGSGLHFALQGFPEGAPLPPTLLGSTLVLDAARVPTTILESRVRLLLDAGLRPLVRNVDDRATRLRVLAAGVPMICGRLLTRGASTPVDESAEASALRALRTLAGYADGRPADAAFDKYVHEDQHLGASLLRVLGSASLGARGPRSVAHALNILGRDAVMERLLAVTARLLADAAHDPELALIALRRARLIERLGAAVDGAPHPRARAIAGLLSIAEFALGMPAMQLAERLELPAVLADVLGDRALPLGQLVDVVDAMDYGWWDDLRSRCARLGVAPLVVSEAWLAAWRAAREELG
jgi:EAL and modified HD-GYP domain-containing signal transduction protein